MTRIMDVSRHREALKQQANMAAYMLASSSQDKAAVELWMRNAQAELTAAWNAFAAYSELRTCAGSA